ncbi:MAG: TetR/AcrR family transcriptional regulator [Alphaproteobacteria bacterium]|nr:TetR/AcrR family transcriptional regulator [Alphaproteobacteria bacterium]
MITQFEVPHRRARKTATYTSLVGAARALCQRQGFVGLRTADVAKAAGVSHGAVFAHFPTREMLLKSIVHDLTASLTDRLAELVTLGASLRAVLAAHLACLAEQEDLYRRLLIEAPLLPESFQLAWIGFQSAVSHHLAEAVAIERAGGSLRPIAHHLLFNTWIGLVHHYCINRELFAPGQSVFTARAEMLINHFLSLVSLNPQEPP